MEYNTEVQRRLAQILDELNIKTTYIKRDDAFILEDSGLVIFEDKRKVARPAPYLIQIFNDGTLRFADGGDVSIKYCKLCRKFSFGRKVSRIDDKCPFCKEHSFKYLSNNSKIPGWFGKEENSLIDEQEAERHLASIPGDNDDKNKEAIRECIEKLSGEVSYITVSSEKKEKVLKLAEKYPNMQEIIDYLVQSFESSNFRKHKEISFRPIVLVGSPGCGKTSFVTDLGNILQGKKAVKIDLGNDVPVFAISGSDPQFSRAKQGLITEAMSKNSEHGPLKNPLIHFDELDKIHSKENYWVETVFYSILEKNTARRFFDNYIGINVDASGVNYIFTANSLENIPKPIISRLKIFQIPDYTAEQFKACVIDNFYHNWLKNNDMEQEFLPAVLSNEIKEEILKECGGDTRNIEDAINKVFTRTMQKDDETGHSLALFSPKEYFIGWKKFRGKRNISQNSWTLPVDFL